MQMLILLMALTVCQVTSQIDQSSEDTLERTGNSGDILSDIIESDSLRDEADPIFLGFSCPKGHSSVPVVYCLPCDYGTYMGNKSFNVCKKCPPDSTTLRKGAESRKECVSFCPPGYEMSQCNKTCTKCRPGTFKSNWEKSSPCSKCPLSSHPPKDVGLTDESQCHLGDCIMSCKLRSEESLICRSSVKPYMRCLNNCSANQYQKDYLLRSFSKLHPDLGSQLMHKLNNNETWKQIYDWYKEACPDQLCGTKDDSQEELWPYPWRFGEFHVMVYVTCSTRGWRDGTRHKIERVLLLERVNSIDSSTISQKCKNSSLIIPHPSECQAYYNCSIPYTGLQLRALEERMVECPYPQLFNTETEKCEEFDKVDCGSRTEIADACKYRKTQCYRSHCIPCQFRFHSCINKPDGANVRPNYEYTDDTFIICYKERYISSENCPKDSNGDRLAFHPTLRTCVPWPKYGGTFTNECAFLSDGNHLDFSGRCDQFRVCKDAKATTVKCNKGEVYDNIRKLCWPYKSACGFCSASKNRYSCKP